MEDEMTNRTQIASNEPQAAPPPPADAQ